MKFIATSLLAAGLMAGSSAMAANMPDIAKRNSCDACHTINKKLVGPAWVDISRKYKGDAAAKAMLANKIIKGSSGVWGAMPMPPNQKLSETEAAMLADFILGLTK